MTNELLALAISDAAYAHKDQLDKAGKAYILHPLRVMLSLAHESLEIQIVAILHDTVEDTPMTLEMIRDNYGEVIANAVESVTRIVEPTKETYTSLINRAKNNSIGRIVKIADLKDNMSKERIEALPVAEQGIIRRYQKALEELER